MIRLHWLDELRAFAVLMVLIPHYSFLVPAIRYLPSTGVQLFYMISGFILFTLYSEKITNLKSYGRFMMKRFFRIAPLFYASMLLFGATFYPFLDLSAFNIITHLLLFPFGFFQETLNGIISLEWSIYVEWSFYMVFPLLLFFLKKSPSITLGATFLLSFGQLYLAHVLGYDTATRTFLYEQPTAQLIFFLTGMALAWFSSHKSFDIPSARRLLWCGVAGLWLMQIFVPIFALRLMISLFCFVAIFLSFPSLKKSEGLEKILRWIGLRGYSIYLLHRLPILAIQHGYVPDTFLFILLSVPFTFLLSDLSYRLIEVPCITLGRKLSV